jgi:GWxTD domain-containing protein
MRFRFSPVFVLVLSIVGSANGQEPRSSPQASSSQQQAGKKQRKRAHRELGDTRLDWLEQEAIYIISPAERSAFLKLGTNEERDKFIEHFWQLRNPDPDSPENSFREEHYRRIAYANEHFSSGIPGWKSDRGHIYILWGPPDEIDSHPTGGTYDRPSWQGGGSTSTYAWELWRYRHLEDLGDNLELEFVDPTGSGEYHLTRDPGEKDALAHVPGAGPSLSEILHGGSKADRFSNSNGTTLPAPLGGVPASQNEFATLDLYFRVMRPPEHFKDMTALVSSRLIGNPIHVDFSVDYLRVTDSSVLVPITLQIPNREMSYRDNQGVQSANLNLYARITSPSGNVVQTFEESIARDIPSGLLPKMIDQPSIFQKAVPLSPGLYKLDVVIKDLESGNIGTVQTALRVPRFENDQLAASSLILADKIEAVPSTQIGLGPFVLGSYMVRPRLSHEFSSTENLGIFLQLYNVKRDQVFDAPSVRVTYKVLKNREEVWTSTEGSDSIRQSGEQITLNRLLPLAAFAPGAYTLEIRVEDRVSGQSLTKSADFQIKP